MNRVYLKCDCVPWPPGLSRVRKRLSRQHPGRHATGRGDGGNADGGVSGAAHWSAVSAPALDRD
ncbi:hypothetical protein J6590_061221 [Homalodisca vitripennis]|nr:hypothetical protein J6590_061221 [Homalodisca vitripennis]